jgi:hypothetical protein
MSIGTFAGCGDPSAAAGCTTRAGGAIRPVCPRLAIVATPPAADATYP